MFTLLAVGIGASPMDACIDQLTDKDVAMRTAALDDFRHNLAECDRRLLRHLKEVLAKPDTTYRGRTHTVLDAVAFSRSDEGVPDLVAMIDFQLDPDTFPVGARRPLSVYYPVATTLRDIGNRKVVDEILSSFTKERPERALRMSAWVLQEILGHDVATFVIARAEADAKGDHKTMVTWVGKILDEDSILMKPIRQHKTP
jgi:hypothetical protein